MVTVEEDMAVLIIVAVEVMSISAEEVDLDTAAVDKVAVMVIVAVDTLKITSDIAEVVDTVVGKTIDSVNVWNDCFKLVPQLELFAFCHQINFLFFCN